MLTDEQVGLYNMVTDGRSSNPQLLTHFLVTFSLDFAKTEDQPSFWRQHFNYLEKHLCIFPSTLMNSGFCCILPLRNQPGIDLFISCGFSKIIITLVGGNAKYIST